jgi:hypothetical protein
MVFHACFTRARGYQICRVGVKWRDSPREDRKVGHVDA